MSREQLQVLSLALEERRRVLQAELRRDAERARAESYSEIAGAAPDLGDAALADLISDLENAELTRDLNELRALEAALDRLDNAAAYGRCAECSMEIPFERLRAEPAALRCIDCQRVHERTYTGTQTPKL
ncbi:MAG: TraR/DksA family transcriptional regulator [Burkholderiales bacterium]